MRDLDGHLLRALRPTGDWQPSGLKKAAVLCPIVARDGEDHLLFVLRPETMTSHAGQVAFPGGKRDGAESPLETALRECREEVGAEERHITPLGELPPRGSSSGMQVHCVVARVAPFEPVPQPDEVARVLYAPLAELADAARWHERRPAIAPSTPRTSPHYELDGALLWGLTARFVLDLVRLHPSA